MDVEKEENEKKKFQKKKTQQKPMDKNDNIFEGNDSPVPAEIGNSEFNDMSVREPNETKFVH